MFRAGLILMAMAVPATAQVPCMPLATALGEITGPRYSEAEVFHANLPDNQGVLRLFANAKTGTWTEMVVQPDKGLACLILAGKGFAPGAMDDDKPGKPL